MIRVAGHRSQYRGISCMICRLWFSALVLVMVTALLSCSSTRHVPSGESLLDKVRIDMSADSTHAFTAEELNMYVRQQPNHKMLWSVKLQLGIYNMSGRDTSHWWNRWIRKIGEAPVIYDSTLTAAGRQQLRQAMVNKGFLLAESEALVTRDKKGRKTSVKYVVRPGVAHKIASIGYEFPNDTIRDIIMSDTTKFAIREGVPLDRTLLEAQRDLMTNLLRNKGYYGFTKEFVSFNADTTAGSHDVDLTVRLAGAYPDNPSTHTPYIIRNIRVVTNYNSLAQESISEIAATDTAYYKDLQIFYGASHYLRPSVIYENCYLRAGMPYRQTDIDRTYEAFSRLGILKFVNVRFIPVSGSPDLIDAYILLTPTRSQSIAFELEGTNSEGDLGMAASVTYTHRNIGHGAETLTTKVRGAYESISGNLDGLLHNRYLEYSVEGDISFPKFKFPFLRENFKRKVKASTQFNLSLNYQERPEYTRIISTAGWSYRWVDPLARMRHVFTPIDINYVNLPESTQDFLDQIAPDNPLLRYSYENHFIMRMGYSFYYSTKRTPLPGQRNMQRNVSTVRAHAETAGNLLFAISSIFAGRRNFHSDPYKVFGINYSQYFKIEGDYSFMHQFDRRNSLALHAGFGIGVPYGNSQILPFEKRFYGGGANGVRGWDVRTLGPGSYPGTNSVSDFIHQCGDIRLDMNVEYRARLFWVLELGAFVDAGNIWTIRSYPSQPGGVFKFNKFAKQLAAAYGLGIRMDFDYFLIRFDMGMKAHNPAMGVEPWPLLHPRWKRDSSFHFSIGYPF